MIHALHGALGHRSDWKPIADKLAKHGHITRAMDLWRLLDCRSLAMEDAGRWINEEAIASASETPVLMGYSMGARLGLHALLDELSPWKAAILIAPHTGLSEESERSARLSSDARWAAKALSSHWKKFIEEWNQQGVLSDCKTPDRTHLKQRRLAVALSYTSWSLGTQENLLPRLCEIQIPVLWITGAKDTKFTAIAKQAVKEIPDASHLEIQGAGHRCIFSHPDEISEAVATFLDSYNK